MDADVQVAGVPAPTVRPDVVLPSQYYGPPRKQTPEARLMIAVLQEALDCFAKYRFATDIHDRRVFDEARQWLLANEPDWPYSFERICAALDIDSAAVRQRLGVAPEPELVPERSGALFQA